MDAFKGTHTRVPRPFFGTHELNDFPGAADVEVARNPNAPEAFQNRVKLIIKPVGKKRLDAPGTEPSRRQRDVVQHREVRHGPL